MLDKLYSVYPFNRFEYVLSHLIAEGVITLDNYIDIRNRYLNRNKYLYLFEITAPRTFGETWAQRHLNEIVPELERPTTQKDPNYSGQYDFWYDDIKIEVKEDGKTAEENAIKKAKAYYEKTKLATIAEDSGLWVEKFLEEDQPGLFVKRVNGREDLSDEEILNCYIEKLNANIIFYISYQFLSARLQHQ